MYMYRTWMAMACSTMPRHGRCCTAHVTIVRGYIVLAWPYRLFSETTWHCIDACTHVRRFGRWANTLIWRSHLEGSYYVTASRASAYQAANVPRVR